MPTTRDGRDRCRAGTPRWCGGGRRSRRAPRPDRRGRPAAPRVHASIGGTRTPHARPARARRHRGTRVAAGVEHEVEVGVEVADPVPTPDRADQVRRAVDLHHAQRCRTLLSTAPARGARDRQCVPALPVGLRRFVEDLGGHRRVHRDEIGLRHVARLAMRRPLARRSELVGWTLHVRDGALSVVVTQLDTHQGRNMERPGMKLLTRL